MSHAADNIPRIVRTLLAFRGRSQTELAAHLHLKQPAISKALSGRRQWTVTDIEGMAEFFDVPISLFFEDPDTIVRSSRFRRDLVSA